MPRSRSQRSSSSSSSGSFELGSPRMRPRSGAGRSRSSSRGPSSANDRRSPNKHGNNGSATSKQRRARALGLLAGSLAILAFVGAGPGSSSFGLRANDRHSRILSAVAELDSMYGEGELPQVFEEQAAIVKAAKASSSASGGGDTMFGSLGSGGFFGEVPDIPGDNNGDNSNRDGGHSKHSLHSEHSRHTERSRHNSGRSRHSAHSHRSDRDDGHDTKILKYVADSAGSSHVDVDVGGIAKTMYGGADDRDSDGGDLSRERDANTYGGVSSTTSEAGFKASTDGIDYGATASSSMSGGTSSSGTPSHYQPREQTFDRDGAPSGGSSAPSGGASGEVDVDKFLAKYGLDRTDLELLLQIKQHRGSSMQGSSSENSGSRKESAVENDGFAHQEQAEATEGSPLLSSTNSMSSMASSNPTTPTGSTTMEQPSSMMMEQPISSSGGSDKMLTVTTWNIAAINNNPFEYWITMKDEPMYEQLMINVEAFLENPGNYDVPVSEVFTDEMFNALEGRMDQVGWPNVREYWEKDFKNRKIVSGFMKDPLLGSKRLASMPDRVTNTINVVGSDQPVCRPTVINMYDGDLSTLPMWFEAWEKFMFDTPLTINTKDGEKSAAPYEMLLPIKRSKYPDVTEDEEKVSLPLQTMCGAIFDAILVHMMNTVADPPVWQGLKRIMVDSLNKMKVPHTLEILSNVYSNSDILTLQEVSLAFINQALNTPLGRDYHIIAPSDLDAVRDQNSVIFLRKDTFPDGATGEISGLVADSFERGVDVPVAKGDILAITTTDRDGVPYVVASFHGDTNGLATKPVVDAVVKAMRSEPALASHRLIFGLDANTYEHAKPNKQQDVYDFAQSYVSHGLTSCWGDYPNPDGYTTFNSRTYLQPQLNKACKSSEKRKNGDVNPKDFIIFQQRAFDVVTTWKDNTGKKEYIEDMAFPTLDFPSDHGILSTVLKPKL